MAQSASAPSTQRRQGLPPGPRHWPLLGDPSALRGMRNLLEYYEHYWKRYGDVFRVRIMGTSMVVLAHPDALKHVLWTKRHNYVKGAAYDSVRRVMGSSLVTLEGEPWKERRALAQPAFHRRSLEKLTTTMLARGARYFDELAARCAGGELEIDAQREMVKLTLDVVVNALFGQALESSSVSHEALGATLELITEGSSGIVLPAWVPTPHNRRLHRTIAELDRVVYGFIDTARRKGFDDGSLLAMLLAARDAQGEPLPDEAIRDEVLTLFLAGHETTALTLTWLFALLDRQPQVLARMQAEAYEVLQGRDPGFEDVPKLTYLRQVLDETMRLRPAAAFVARNVVADDEIDGYRLHAGEMVLLFFWGAHHHPDFWPDAATFDPERFTPERDKTRNSWSYLPFSAGPRSCIGNMFSLTESAVLIAQLLNRFEIQVHPCADVKPVSVGTTRPSRPIRLTLRVKTGVQA